MSHQITMEIVGPVRNCVKFLQVLQPGFLSPGIQGLLNAQQVRHRQTKHWNPKFKRLRKEKFIKIDIPDFQEKFEDLSKEEVRSRMKERGVLPPRPWLERPFHISCTGGMFEPYVPPEGDGKKSIISSTGAKQKFEFLGMKGKSIMAVRKIKSYEEDFDKDDFALKAQDIYIGAHQFMAEKKKHDLRQHVTERCYPEMIHNTKDKTIHWKFLKSLEPPKVVHARCTDIITKENIFAQVTVRFHTQQQLAIYDRFGRLMHGSEILAKDVLEYVVFEKHISNEYGIWRMHDKIIPDWLPPRQPSPHTFVVIEEPEEQPKQIEEAVQKDEKVEQIQAGSSDTPKEKLIPA